MKPPTDPIPLPKENFLYSVTFPGTRIVTSNNIAWCGTVQQCARTCSAGLPGFDAGVRKFQLEDKDRKVTFSGLAVLGDPLLWLDPTEYAAGASPYLVPGYYHPMSFYRALPGARYAHRNRAGESCSYYAAPYHMIGTLIPDCVDMNDKASCTITHCDPLPVATPGSP